MKTQKDKKGIAPWEEKTINVSSICVWIVGVIYFSYHYWSWFFSFPDPPSPFVIFVAAIIYTMLFSFFAKGSVFAAYFIGLLITILASIIYKITTWFNKKLRR